MLRYHRKKERFLLSELSASLEKECRGGGKGRQEVESEKKTYAYSYGLFY